MINYIPYDMFEIQMCMKCIKETSLNMYMDDCINCDIYKYRKRNVIKKGKKNVSSLDSYIEGSKVTQKDKDEEEEKEFGINSVEDWM